jgi:aminopeptidase N
MLRHVAPDDATFFNALKTYQQQYAFKTATTADFQKIMEAAYGRPLDTFFNQWIYDQGFPTYTASWNQLGSDVFLKLVQTTSVPSSVAVFAMPVTLQLTSAAGDTLVKVYFDTVQQIYHFKWDRAMTNVVIDPNNDILNHVQPVIRDQTLSVRSLAADKVRVYPNPAGRSWQVTGIVPGASLQLADAMGRIVWQLDDAPAGLSIDSSSLAPGIYTLIIRQSKSQVITRMLEKR